MRMIMGLGSAVPSRVRAPASLADISVSRAVSIRHFLSQGKANKGVITSVNQTLEDTGRANNTSNIDPNSLLGNWGLKVSLEPIFSMRDFCFCFPQLLDECSITGHVLSSLEEK